MTSGNDMNRRNLLKALASGASFGLTGTVVAKEVLAETLPRLPALPPVPQPAAGFAWLPGYLDAVAHDFVVWEDIGLFYPGKTSPYLDRLCGLHQISQWRIVHGEIITPPDIWERGGLVTTVYVKPYAKLRCEIYTCGLNPRDDAVVEAWMEQECGTYVMEPYRSTEPQKVTL